MDNKEKKVCYILGSFLLLINVTMFILMISVTIKINRRHHRFCEHRFPNHMHYNWENKMPSRHKLDEPITNEKPSVE